MWKYFIVVLDFLYFLHYKKNAPAFMPERFDMLYLFYLMIFCVFTNLFPCFLVKLTIPEIIFPIILRNRFYHTSRIATFGAIWQLSPIFTFATSPIPSKSERSIKFSFCKSLRHFSAPQRPRHPIYMAAAHLFFLYYSCHFSFHSLFFYTNPFIIRKLLCFLNHNLTAEHFFIILIVLLQKLRCI